jgi:1-acyl-sn-glycerol-3-phosphate acyltransferase
VGILLMFCLLQIALIYGRSSAARREHLVRVWAQRLLRVLKVAVSYQTPDDKPQIISGLLVCNHISFLDIFVINSVLPSPFVAKSNIASWPLIGWLVARTGTEFIQRGSKTAAHQTQQRITTRLADGERLAIFPEGTTSNGAQVLPFHAALFQSAIDSAAPLHCMALSYHNPEGLITDAPAFIGDTTLLQCMFNIACANGMTAKLQLLPIDEQKASDRRKMAHRAQHRIATAIASINASVAAAS